QLGADECRHRVVDLGAEDHDAVFQQARVEVEGPLASLTLLQHCWYEIPLGHVDHSHVTVFGNVQPLDCRLDGGRMMSNSEVAREITLPAPPDEVWEALTDPAQLAAWFGGDLEIDPTPGGVTRYRGDDGE